MNTDFPALEREILDFWEREQCFRKLKEQNAGCPRWSFLDGPITANNPMGVHHAWGRTYKDLYQRYHAMTGHELRYQNGFDCQGLWVEVEVEKELGFTSKRDIETYGIDRFVDRCKERVKKFAQIQTEQSIRLGYWMDWENSYFTMSDENNYTIWQFLQRCHERGFLYRGCDSMPWCPRCGTGISQHEIHSEDRPMVVHDSPTVRLPIRGREREYLLIWTTTPWTLTSNVACAVNPELTYAKVRQDDVYYLVEDRVEAVMAAKGSVEVMERLPGKALVGWEYDGPFDELPAQIDVGHRVIPWKEVSAAEGTGIAHIAPGCGKEDYELGREHRLPAISPIDESGIFLDGFGTYTGRIASEVAESIFESLREKDTLYRVDPYAHGYPICWRCKTQLLFRVVEEWYISMGGSNPPSGLRKEIIDVTKQTRWIPEVGQQLEIEWLLNMQDWMISKKRYWGLALPIYLCRECTTFDVVGGKDELRERAVDGWEQFDGHTPHRPWVDAVKIACKSCGAAVSRIPDVGNPWLDAGIVPYSTMHYNSDRAYWEKWFPADWISECFPGQFRNWFYSILAISTVMENRRPFKLMFGYKLMKAEDGEEMHKSKGNTIFLDEAAEREGADVMRWLYASHNPDFDLRFGLNKIHDARREFLVLWNTYQFFLTYSRIDDFDPTASPLLTENRSELDRWILGRLEKLIESAHCNYSQFSVHRFMRDVKAFIDDLSRWYLRRSRRRIWKNEDNEDKLAAYQTLWECLVTSVKLLAPVIPFATEAMYQVLVRHHDGDAPVSVHLCDLPRPGAIDVDEDLQDSVEAVRALIEQGHAARQHAGLRIRQPVGEIRVVSEYKDIAEKLKPLVPLILEELNVKEVGFVDSVEDFYVRSARLEAKVGGPKYKRHFNPLKEALAAIDIEELETQLENAGEVVLESGGETFRVPRQEVTIDKVTAEGWELSAAGGFLVALDTRLTDDLIREGLARDLVRKIQNLRKKLDLQMADRIRLTYTAPDHVAEIIEAFREYLAAEVQATELKRQTGPLVAGHSVKVADHEIRIAIDTATGGRSAYDLLTIGRQSLYEDLFGNALQAFDEAVAADPSVKEKLRAEFGHLFKNRTLVSRHRQPECLLWQNSIWKLLAASSRYSIPGSPADPPCDKTEETSQGTGHPPTPRVRESPALRGRVLEEGIIRILADLFHIGGKERKQILTTLRKQNSGAQFGHDLSFDFTFSAPARGPRSVRCIVECKNYSRPVTPADVCHKVDEAEEEFEGGDRFDQWILVSPHADPSNQLDRLLRSWEERSRYPFDIQVWSPQTGVRDLMALSPGVFRDLYGEDRQISNDRRSRIVEEWLGRLVPRLSLPVEWRRYLGNPRGLLISHESFEDRERLFRLHVTLPCRDSAGRPLPETLEERTARWLREDKGRVMLVVGTFGSGKTAFGYVLARRLLGEFRKRPRSAYFPVRMALGDFSTFRTVGELVENRLAELQVERKSWYQLCREARVLVILDGFDEMSRELDPDSVSESIKRLLELYESAIFGSCRFLITSRPHFFTTRRDRQRIFERLGDPLVLRIGDFSPAAVEDYLQAVVTTPQERRALARLRELHDPMGLARKALFLEFVRETLTRRRKRMLDEATLYEEYVSRCLERELQSLEDVSLRVGRDDLKHNLIKIMELIAKELEQGGRNFVDLRTFLGEKDERLGELLWRMSESAVAMDSSGGLVTEEDATMRVGVRSLLQTVPTAERAGWPVDFFHRSMREYFYARAITRAIENEDLETAMQWLSKRQLSPEIARFAGLVMQRSREQCEQQLRSIVQRSRTMHSEQYLGGNIVTLLYQMLERLPQWDWSQKRLEFVRLEGADLSGVSFVRSKLCYANLDNSNLEDADLRFADLRGVRLEETLPVRTLTVDREGRQILVAYDDGSILSWPQAKGSHPTNVKSGRRRDTHFLLAHGPERTFASVGNGEVIFFDNKTQVSRFRLKTDLRHVRPKREVVVIVRTNGNAEAIELKGCRNLWTVRANRAEWVECLGRDVAVVPVAGGGIKFLKVGADGEEVIGRIGVEARCGSVWEEREGLGHLLGLGGANGEVGVWRIRKKGERFEKERLFWRQLHEGVVTDLRFLNAFSVLSGGEDRSVRETLFDVGGEGCRAGREWRLSLKCKGVKIDGVQGPSEYEQLLALRQRAEGA